MSYADTGNIRRAIARTVVLAGVGGIAGAIGLVSLFAVRPDFALDMDRELPQNVTGVYPPERAGEISFAWTGEHADLRLRGLDRHQPWSCAVRFRGGRPSPVPQPRITLSVDGIAVGSSVATNEYRTLEVTAPARELPGLVLSLLASPTMRAGPHDQRDLGVQLDRIQCHPAGRGIALPPRRALATATLTGAAFGAAFGLLQLTTGAAVGATFLVAAMQALPLAAGAAPYGAYNDAARRLALWVSILIVVAGHALERWKVARLENSARFVVAFAGAALYLKLLALLHPSKSLVDAVFQAHRLEWVLSGRYFFTQSISQSVQFPYAIGLYVFAAPWTLVTRDFITLLRVVVCATESVAGALLYPMIVRNGGDRLSGGVAVVLFQVTPMAFWFIGNANLPNVFGQMMALIAIAWATILPLRSGQYLPVAALVAVTSLALLSHVSTFALLVATLGALAASYRWLGTPDLRLRARLIGWATAAAILIAVVAYYGHFADVYMRALRVRATAVAAPAADRSIVDGARGANTGGAATPFTARAADALILSTRAVGWPILLLAATGAWRTWQARSRDPVVLAVVAWITAYIGLVVVGLMRVDPHYQRYSAEFVGRVAYATYPAAIILAATGASWGWRAGPLFRIGTAGLIACAIVLGAQGWLGWLQ